jgi:hypothetical protein
MYSEAIKSTQRLNLPLSKGITMNQDELYNTRLSALRKEDVAVVGIVRNVQGDLKTDIDRIKSSLSDFAKIRWFLVESDSSDLSVDALEAASQSEENFHYISLGNLEERFGSRTERMAFARNRYLHELTDNSVFNSVTYVVIADFNNLNSQISRDSIRSCWSHNDWDVCTANQSGKYYDIWALRHQLWSPNDCWEQHAFYRKFMRNPEKALFVALHSRMIHIPEDSEWIEVESAFGGFAIYKKDHLLRARYLGIKSDGQVVCEHVLMHEQMRLEGSRIFLNPRMINMDYTDHSLNSNTWARFRRSMLYPQKYLKKKLS